MQMDSLIGEMESGLRLKIFSSAQRKPFFAHLKGAEQIRFLNAPGASLAGAGPLHGAIHASIPSP